MSDQTSCYNLSTAHRQLFCFPPDVIKYMIKNCNASIWFKVIKLCKYFYATHKACILKDITLDEKGTLAAKDNNNFYRCWESDIPCKYYLIEKFSVWSSLEVVRPKIYKCLIRHLSISKIDIGFDDFKFLTGSNLLNEFEMHDSDIVHSDKSVVQLEDIFVALPYVTSFIHERNSIILPITFINDQTFHRMAAISRCRLLTVFKLSIIPNDINVEDFVKFVTNYADNNCIISLTFPFVIPINLKTAVNQMLEKWMPQSTKPDIEFKIFMGGGRRPSNRRLQQTHAVVHEYCLTMHVHVEKVRER